ncbi:MAG TPA: hypothetical protein VLW55_08445 [Burkholderiaceae bacterium]|nr:hypothetical protein [Burkholderiaceae bacterium]
MRGTHGFALVDPRELDAAQALIIVERIRAFFADGRGANETTERRA